jgi:diguanylate cyclase (GGDEF)-like protein
MNPALAATVNFMPMAPIAGGWLRSIFMPGRSIPADHCDRSTGLYNRAGLFAATDEILQSRGGDLPTSVIVIEFADLSEVYDIYGAAIARKVVARIVSRLRNVAGRSGLVGRTGPVEFTIVLPGAQGDKALRSVQRGLGMPACVEFDAGDSEIVLVPELLIDTAQSAHERIPSLYREMCRELSRIRKDEDRRLHWLTSERERHSRPMMVA